MTEIQVIFLFTSQKNLSTEQKCQVQEIVKKEYVRFFNITDAINVKLYDGQAISNPNDIIISIASNTPIINEGRLRGEMRDFIAEKLGNLSYMKGMGFNGKIGLRDGLIEPKETGDERNTAADLSDKSTNGQTDRMDYMERAKQYIAKEPKYSFDCLKISQETKDKINNALDRIRYEHEVFDEWGLYAIMPSPVCAMSFYGAPGTGKSMAAEAIAQKLGKPIIRASYADIENKYVGEGPKNVSAIFLAAEQQDAVLFIDEADSLLSKRLVNVADPSGQAMNSMRSQLLICLENFHGVVIFATNLVVNYDRAFESRLINVEFKIPDVKTRKEIWESHIYSSSESKVKLKIPIATDINLGELAEKYEFVGRDIRNCVVNACVTARSRKFMRLTQGLLIEAAENLLKAADGLAAAEDTTAQTKKATSEQYTMAEIIRQTKKKHIGLTETTEDSV